MKVVFLVSRHSPLRAVSRCALTQAAWLSAHHNVSTVQALPSPHRMLPLPPAVEHVLLQGPGSRRRRHVSTRLSEPELERLAALPSRIVSTAWEPGWSAFTDLAAEDALARLSADVVVTTSPGTLALSALLPRTIPVVHLERLPVKGRSEHLAALLAHAARPDSVVVSDPCSADYLRVLLGPSGPAVVVLDDPLDPGFRPGAPRTDRVVLAAGRLSFDQHHGSLIRAFREFTREQPGWRLRILGEGGMRGALENWVRKEALVDRVELPGVSLDMATEWARASIAVSTPGRGVSMSLREAMAAGLPVVAVDTPEGARHLVEHGRTGWLVSEGSDAALAAGLLQVAEDAAGAAAMGAAARARATAWSPDAVMPRWQELYERTAAERRRRSPGRAGAAGARPAVAPGQPARPPRPPLRLTPRECLHAVLEMLVGAAARIGGPSFVLRPVGDRPARLVVPAPQRRALLEALEAGGRDFEVLPSRHELGPGWPHGPLDQSAPALRGSGVPTVSVSRANLPGTDPRAWNAHVDVEFWEVLDERWLAPGHNDWVVDLPQPPPLVAGEVADVPVRTLALATEPTIWDRSFPVDVVYTWVDGADPAWAARRDGRLQEVTHGVATKQSSGRARYTSRDELRYSLRSVHMFAPWVRRVFIVTDRQVPAWLDTAQDTVTVVDHADLLPQDALPTFNSHAIETALHKIPGLAEHFVYFNDDVLLGRPVRPDQFFGPAGQAAVYPPVVPIGLRQPRASPHTHAGINNRELLHDSCGVTLTRHLTHTPHPLRRSTFLQVAERFDEAVDRTARSPFRSNADVAVASSLVQHYGLLTGDFIESTMLTNLFVALTSPMLPDTLEALLEERGVDTFCLGDHHEWGIPQARVNALVRAFLEAYFPVASRWELG